MSTTMMMSDNASIYPSKVPMYEGGRASPVPTLVPGYDRYLSRGPQQSEIELSRLDLNYNDQQPLLPPGQSTVSLPGYASPPQAMYQSPAQQYPPAQPAAYNGAGLVMGDGFREAPVHRPYPSQQGSYASQQRPYPPSQNGSSGSWAQPPPTEQGEVNMAGRGTFRR